MNGNFLLKKSVLFNKELDKKKKEIDSNFPWYPYGILNNFIIVLSTRVARFTPNGTSIQKSPLAYLLSSDESNNDATNYWIFSEAGLRRLFDRTGWDVLNMITVGDKKASNPRDQDHDERAFSLLRSRNI